MTTRAGRWVAVVVLMAGLWARAAAEVEPFTFIHISDSHVGAPGGEQGLIDALADIKANYAHADFVIHSGDLTEMGFVEEFTSYTLAIDGFPIPIHHVSGNHDTRWSESGKENYRKFIGETYTSFTHKGLCFIQMDSSMLLEHYGHFDGQQMEQLDRDLRGLPEGMPAVVTMHHPPLSTGRYFDNDYEFADVIRRHYVPLVLDGHGHSFQRYMYNGTTFAMGGSVSEKGADKRAYVVYEVTPTEFKRIKRRYTEDVTEEDDPVPIGRTATSYGELTPVPAVAAPRRPGEVRFQIDLPDPPAIKAVTYLLDGYATGTVKIGRDGSFSMPTRTMACGRHQLVLRIEDTSGTMYTRSCYFLTDDCTVDVPAPAPPARRGQRIRRPASVAKPGPTVTHEFPLPSGGQSHLVAEDGVLYAGANDGMLRAFDFETRQLKWSANLNREILSAPVLADGKVIIGSLDNNVYALNAGTGDVVWKRETGAPVLASARIVGDTVFIGSGDAHMYALDLATGDVKWKFAAQKLIKNTPAYADGHLFFGAWDNRFYAVDAATGRGIWDVPASTMYLFSSATCNPETTQTNVITVTHDYSIRCLSQRTGSHVWVYQPKPDELGPSYSSPVFRGNNAYFGSIAGRVVGHDVRTGEKVCDVEVRPERTDALFDSIPLLEGSRIYIGSVGGNLYCVDVDEQRVVWRVALQPGFIFTRPAKWGDRIYVSSLAGRVFEVTIPEGL